MSLDKDLQESIARFVSSGDAGLAILDEAQAASLVGEVAERFVNDPNALWWWDGLAEESWQIAYGDTDGLKQIERLLEKETTPVFWSSQTTSTHPGW